MTALDKIIVDISTTIDANYPADLDAETHRWRRCMKVAEETGEVTEALLGLVGENPRKGVTHGLADLESELLDVALAALGAYAHIRDNDCDPIDELHNRAAFVHERLLLSITHQNGAAS